MKRLLKTPITLCLMAIVIGLTSCLDEAPSENPYKRLEKEIAQIDAELLGMSNVIKDPSGIRIVVHQLGTGLPATLTNKIDVDYEGRLFSTGEVFDEGNTAQAIEQRKLGQYIDGWKLAFSILPTGTIATLYIPSGYGYGNRANGSIPANSILEFSVKFNEIVETNDELTQFKNDTTAIETYLAGKGITEIVTDTTGVRYKITQNGNGDNATWFDQITLSYKIYLLSNDTSPVITVTDRAPSTAFGSRLVDYVNGMKLGLSKMNPGSKATLYVPSGLAFGPDGAANNTGTVVIPPNTNVIIEIEVKDIDYGFL
jgi:FKBP-type peptidyl-prolyl cis-trans isomerase